MKFRPLHDRVVVRRVEEDTKTKGGIIIPDTRKRSPCRAKSSLLVQVDAMRPAS